MPHQLFVGYLGCGTAPFAMLGGTLWQAAKTGNLKAVPWRNLEVPPTSPWQNGQQNHGWFPHKEPKKHNQVEEFLQKFTRWFFFRTLLRIWQSFLGMPKWSLATKREMVDCLTTGAWVGSPPPPSHCSGQFIATENTTDFPQNVVFWKLNPRLFQRNLGWWHIILWPDCW